MLLLLILSCERSDEVSSAVADPCAPVVVHCSIVSCCGAPMWVWDGAACVDQGSTIGVCGCGCEPHDATYLTEDACARAHASCPVRPRGPVLDL